jgi:hypothetical protein
MTTLRKCHSTGVELAKDDPRGASAAIVRKTTPYENRTSKAACLTSLIRICYNVSCVRVPFDLFESLFGVIEQYCYPLILGTGLIIT